MFEKLDVGCGWEERVASASIPIDGASRKEWNCDWARLDACLLGDRQIRLTMDWPPETKPPTAVPANSNHPNPLGPLTPAPKRPAPSTAPAGPPTTLRPPADLQRTSDKPPTNLRQTSDRPRVLRQPSDRPPTSDGSPSDLRHTSDKPPADLRQHSGSPPVLGGGGRRVRQL